MKPSRRKLLDALYISVLIWYALAGMMLAPFHGDEATIIHMSKDWYSLMQGNLSEVLYKAQSERGQPTDDQQLRLLNGTISKFAIGLAGWLANFQPEKLNSAWAWGLDWWENLYYGHLPDRGVLFVSRLSSCWLLALSIATMFSIGYHIQCSTMAYLASLIYTLTPSVLLNTRRAMFEGANLLGITLVILAGLVLANVLDGSRPYVPPKKFSNRWLLFGLAAGVALAAKHINIITIGAVAIALIWIERRHPLRLLKYAALSLVSALITFFMLNPTWWNAPFQVPGEVLRLRQQMFSTQVNEFGQYNEPAQRVIALINMPLGTLQYEEDARFDWTQWIGDQISTYEGSIFKGIVWSGLGIILYVILAIGVFAMLRVKQSVRPVLVFTAAIMFAAIFVSNQLPWQRYYLPLVVPLILLLAIGINFLALKVMPHLIALSRQHYHAKTVHRVL